VVTGLVMIWWARMGTSNGSPSVFFSRYSKGRGDDLTHIKQRLGFVDRI